MRKNCVVVFLIIFFNIFAVCGAFGGNYDQKDILPEPDYTEEIIVLCVVLIVGAAVAIDAARKKKPPEPQIQKKNFSRSINPGPYIKFGISPSAAQGKDYVPSVRAGIRF